MVLGTRQVLQTMLRPFKAAVDLGGARGVMMAYSELDGIPSHIHPMLYKALEDWGFDGFVTADDAGLLMLEARHGVSDSPATTIAQWINAGGCNQYYDFDLETYMAAIVQNVANGTIKVSTLQSRVRSLLGV
jgi:beta-glucosidase-like glycosyl hydrolase